MASTTPAASVRGQSTSAPKERSFESFGVIANLKEAKRLLVEAGYPNGFKISNAR